MIIPQGVHREGREKRALRLFFAERSRKKTLRPLLLLLLVNKEELNDKNKENPMGIEFSTMGYGTIALPLSYQRTYSNVYKLNLR